MQSIAGTLVAVLQLRQGRMPRNNFLTRAVRYLASCDYDF